MAAAAILSPEEFRDTQRRAAIRQQLHDRLDHWLDTLEEHVKAPKPTLEQLTQAVLALRRELTQAATEGVVEQAHRAVMAQRKSACPQCGQMLSPAVPRTAPWRRWWERSDSGAHPLTVSAVTCTTPLNEALQVTARRKNPTCSGRRPVDQGALGRDGL